MGILPAATCRSACGRPDVALLTDLFGYLSIVLHGLTIVAQSMAVGGALFLVFLVRPMAATLPEGDTLVRRTSVLAG